MMLLDASSSQSLVNQIVAGITLAINEQRLRPGTKLPSIRKFAQTHKVSHFTAVEAYDRLVALGYLTAVRNAGFYVRSAPDTPAPPPMPSASDDAFDFDAYLLLQKVFQPLGMDLRPGIGLLPEPWSDDDGVQRSLRALSRRDPSEFTGYGHAKGCANLRARLVEKLLDTRVNAHPEQILLTSGASHALDLLVRYLVHRGDSVLVDEPGYHNLFLNLRLQGARLLGVPRTRDGIDLDVLEAQIREHRPKVFFTNTRLQCPTGTSLTLAVAHRLLQLAEKYDFLIVENDIYADLDPSDQQALAGMDQLARVIYVASFSKSIAPSLRVGFVAAHRDLIDELVPLKMASGLTTSAIAEELALEVLLQGRHRKHVKQLQANLALAHEQVARKLEAVGMEIFVKPHAGLFLWARHPQVEDATALAMDAREHKILLAPGQLFMPDARVVPWLRFNVAHAQDERIYQLLEQAAH
ncbi:PLP-dependent aminotransferase family protein [Pseudomonas sp. B21-036]|uniref:aminotransferase-like domain-containing protein n=1 Tax=unclassified Pseudomonas TaxID=196821 RepID=UPI00215EB528|nr:PLP-dependent aminotransferase family protein [Pseudomonas sp. B21-036]UVL53200.1 PLP-dependent aminotransferase family protein [Pseudomonas sp. B21-036]